ncbi:hypothetical protein T552_01623 [Pneumocystis carinii B80]|uniref:MADS-box domain-containing protein n=1 Tax=Pneumocystis carinii (strain B80) TaxID=1408658 RepID=A0A0W4ZJ23_PNEC8|nr:hypothetical protein T552_01623 [Pneumocystis carinii B80]KTW28363.1 hypothetical protein T552_01623 [Pneumocystis carinii B80]
MFLDKQYQSLVPKIKSTTLLPYKPCGKGKTKIAMKYREDKRQRQITASKRLPGLMKKAAQYSELTGAKVVVLVRDEQRRVYRYCSEGESNIEKSANRMLTDPAEKIFTTEQFSEYSEVQNENLEKDETSKFLTNNDSNLQKYEKKDIEIKTNKKEPEEFQNNINEILRLEENSINAAEPFLNSINENFLQWPITSVKLSTYSDLSPQIYEMKLPGSASSFPYNMLNTINYNRNTSDASEKLFDYYSNGTGINPGYENQENNYMNSDVLWYSKKLKMFD